MDPQSHSGTQRSLLRVPVMLLALQKMHALLPVEKALSALVWVLLLVSRSFFFGRRELSYGELVVNKRDPVRVVPLVDASASHLVLLEVKLPLLCLEAFFLHR